MLLAVGVPAELARWSRRTDRVEPHARPLDGVLNTADKVAARDPDPGHLVAVVTTELIGLLGLDGCRYARVAPHLRVVVHSDGRFPVGSA